MPGGLYGELELGKSRGQTPVCPAVFIRPSAFLYVSGSCLNVADAALATPTENTVPDPLEIDTVAPKQVPTATAAVEDASGDTAAAITDATDSPTTARAEEAKSIISTESTVHPQTISGHITLETHARVIVAESQISAFAFYAHESIVAYAEGHSTVIKLVKWGQSNGATTQLGKLEATKDVKMMSIGFSADGQYLATLGGVPSYQVSVWDWRAQKLIASNPNEAPATKITFDPLDSKRFCTSGGDGVVRFWKIKIGFKKFSLSPVSGAESPKQAIIETETPTSVLAAMKYDMQRVDKKEPIKVLPYHHVWDAGHKVYCSNTDGTEVYEFNSDTGACDVVLSTKRDVVTLEEHPQAHEDHKDADAVSSVTELGPAGSMKCISYNAQGFILGGHDGVLRIVSRQGSLIRAINVTNGVPITDITVSPDFKNVVVQAENSRAYIVDLVKDRTLVAVYSDCRDIVAMGAFSLFNKAVTVSLSGLLQFWDVEKQILVRRFLTQSSPSCIGISPVSYLVAVGSSTGHVRIYDANGIYERSPTLVYRQRVHFAPVRKVSFESGGRYMLSSAEDGRIFIYDVYEKFKIVGYLTTTGRLCGTAWHYEELDDQPASLCLYALAYEESAHATLIYKFEVPVDTEITGMGEDGLQISRSQVPQLSYKIDDHIVDIAILPSHLSAGKETFYLMTADRKLKVVTAPSNPNVSERIPLGTPTAEYTDHQRAPAKLGQSNTREWLITWATDGVVTVRSLLEPERSLKIAAHDPYQGGVRDAVFSRDCRSILTVGGDGLLRRWDWKYSTGGRRVALEASENADSLAEEHRLIGDAITECVQALITSAPVIDTADTINEDTIIESITKSKKVEVQTSNEKDTYRSQLELRIKSLSEKLVKAMEKNEATIKLEQIDREEFIIDFEERDRLISDADARLRAIRSQIEEANLRKQVLRNRLKRECWDAMEVVGQSIKSFGKEVLSGRVTEVTNYPIRKRNEETLAMIEKIKRLRRVQMMVHSANRKAAQEDVGNDETQMTISASQSGQHQSSQHALQADAQHGQGISGQSQGQSHAAQHGDAHDIDQKKTFAHNSKNAALLYNSFELTTNERRRIQTHILGEYTLDVKAEFNAKFLDMAKVKQDEITKIEEKNERIATILAQLQLQESIFHPELDDDEVPSRIIEVLDSEVKVEKFVTAEERKRLEEKRRQEEDRQRQQAEDNSRQRALMTMMGGKLEDRAEQDEKVELVKPEWMSKPKEEMSEEERKLLKEFEKKMAIFKEEQEKYRKALETELRKLQGLIVEMCDAFDAQLREFYRKKLLTDQHVHQCELRMIKLTQAVIGSEDDELRERQIMQRLEELKQEKTVCTNEIPEIKKELERCREEYESALKRDKEIERMFKKEFHAMDAHMEALTRLFKRRDNGASEREELNQQLQQALGETKQPQQNKDADLNPFIGIDRETNLFDLNVPPLSQENDTPDGLSLDAWHKLVDFRDKKISAEQDVLVTGRKFTEMQTLVQTVLEESDRIRSETERTTSELAQFLEYRFQSTYNLDALFALKQGQVEVPQAPVVTDYSDAVMIHRSVVEKLNDTIVSLGKAKVEALTEMKDYRKGIHALEWENKMLDFQADDLVIRTRDIQLLRVTKQMQEFIRSGDEHKQVAEIAALEKRADYSQKAHLHKLDEKIKVAQKLESKIQKKRVENANLERDLGVLEGAVAERNRIYDVKAKRPPDARQKDPLRDIYTRRRLIDMAKSQAQDIAILREEVERLRLRTYPAFQA